ncbi:MAG TPA: SagB/ThcOx family dehydrogenase [Thermodesulfobacteriota bacterium]|nr:SagB/ThcOx family dehydrogenase [Thermodesulfobacteriota bacterium]
MKRSALRIFDAEQLMVLVAIGMMAIPSASSGRDAESISKIFRTETTIGAESRLPQQASSPKQERLGRQGQRTMKKIHLPSPNYTGMPLEEAIKKRRSVRQYTGKALSLDQLSQLLFVAQGKTGSVYGHALRAVPSAGALYPLEVYAVVNRVEGVEQGIYHYIPDDHSLELQETGNFSRQLCRAGLGQDVLESSGVTFVLSAVFERTKKKYGERGMRYIYMEAGHASQNIALEAVSLGLGSVSIGAFYDDQVNALIGADGIREAVLYLHAVGAQ